MSGNIELSIRLPDAARNHEVEQLMLSKPGLTPAQAWAEVVKRLTGGWATVTIIKDPTVPFAHRRGRPLLHGLIKFDTDRLCSDGQCGECWGCRQLGQD